MLIAVPLSIYIIAFLVHNVLGVNNITGTDTWTACWNSRKEIKDEIAQSLDVGTRKLKSFSNLE